MSTNIYYILILVSKKIKSIVGYHRDRAHASRHLVGTFFRESSIHKRFCVPKNLGSLPLAVGIHGSIQSLTLSHKCDKIKEEVGDEPTRMGNS